MSRGTVLDAAAALDSQLISQLRNLEEPAGTVIVDVSKVASVHWLALGLLEDCRRHFEHEGGCLVLAGASESLNQALSRLGVSMPQYASVATAQKAMGLWS